MPAVVYTFWFKDGRELNDPSKGWSTEETDREAQAQMAIVFLAPTENTLRHWVQILCLTQNLTTPHPKKKVSNVKIFPSLFLV